MLIDMLTQPVSPLLEQPSTAFGDAQLPAIGAVTAAGMVPGGAELYRQRTGSGVRKGPLGGARLDAEGAKILQKRVSPARALLGPLSGVLWKRISGYGNTVRDGCIRTIVTLVNKSLTEIQQARLQLTH
jgi:hypothetical protein